MAGRSSDDGTGSTAGGDTSGRRGRWWDDVSRHPLLLVVAAALLGSGGLVTWGAQQLVGGAASGTPAPTTTTITTTVTSAAGGPSVGSPEGSGSAPPSGTAGDSVSDFTVQFGPQPLNIGRVDLQTAPPVTSASGAATDVSTFGRTAGGLAELEGSSGAQTARWTEPGSPTAQQCSDLATLVPETDLAVGAGDRVCVAMEDIDGRVHVALLEIMEVTGADPGQGRVVATVTVWRQG